MVRFIPHSSNNSNHESISNYPARPNRKCLDRTEYWLSLTVLPASWGPVSSSTDTEDASILDVCKDFWSQEAVPVGPSYRKWHTYTPHI